MGKQNTPLILGFVNNAARNTFNVSQKQVQNKNSQQKAVKQQKPQQQSWTVVNNNKKTNTKGFQSWADVASRNTKSEIQSSWTNAVKPQQQRSKTMKQQPKQQVQKQQVQKQQVQKQQPQKKSTKNQKTQTQTQTWGWYPASKQEAELKKLNQKVNKNIQGKQGKQSKNQPMKQSKNQTMKQSKNQPMRQQSKKQKMRIAAMKNLKALREAHELIMAQEQKKNYALLRNINTVYDGFNYTFPLQNKRSAWISTNKVGGNKVMSVATLYAIRNAPTVRGNKKPFVQRNGKIIFNNKCIRRAVEGKFTGHKKFRGNRVLTYIPEKWLSKENGYSKGTNYEKYTNMNEPKRNERCYSFKGVY
jgi:hypothetical protein